MTALRLVAAAPAAGAAFNPSPVVTTVVFTDIVDSTRRTTTLGDQQWYATLQQHHTTSRSIVEGHGGRLVRTIGDGVLANFDTPSRAIHCMLELRDALRDLDLPIRVGIHAGEVLIGDDDIGGLTVAIAARLVRVAAPGEIVVSRTVADLVLGASFPLVHRRWHRLKGVPGGWLTLRVGTRRAPGLPLRK